MRDRYYLTESGERAYLTDEEEREDDRIRAMQEALSIRHLEFMEKLNEEARGVNALAMALRTRILSRAAATEGDGEVRA